ncbi:ninjurin-2 isoform X1 [Anthonomus grandis grandis]|uniref:ninjurin-2 isoform X1 n=1 Tax=Anthonomus grandis grandis TaxID=2921223 RepID=UPI002165BF45|nr:ninjurin-2 isoform X1 [Anthonomus grandis grandis]
MTSNVRKNDAEASNNSHNVDGNVVGIVAATTITLFKKSLDVNKYATKKTIAQGLLDVALLTANASQLKYILQVGEKHEFYGLMLSLITISIILQVIQACLCVLLGSALNINKEDHCPNANKANNIILCVNIVIMAVNVIIGTFEMKEGDPVIPWFENATKQSP